MIEQTVYQLSSPGRHGPRLPELDVPMAPLPAARLPPEGVCPYLS